MPPVMPAVGPTPPAESGVAARDGKTPRQSDYRGRFAPSPTGALHFGSLVTAVASFLDARAAGGEWSVRIEDLDTPRVVPGSADLILRTLESFGFEWDGPVLYQSSRNEAYSAAAERLTAAGLAYPCSCSRSEIQAAQPARGGAADELFYPGWCRNGPRAPERGVALRFRAPDAPIRFEDLIQGAVCIDLATECGDFVIVRRDGLFAYQLAVVVDDAEQGITHVVRGADLLHSTPRQIAIQRALALAQPTYAHVPLATDQNGIKLSKSAGAGAVDLDNPSLELWRVLRFLRQSPPQELRVTDLATLWEWAKRNWRAHSLRGIRGAAPEAL
jgi:glutamyl-Q tRNA(Asp) synthetase